MTDLFYDDISQGSKGLKANKSFGMQLSHTLIASKVPQVVL